MVENVRDRADSRETVENCKIPRNRDITKLVTDPLEVRYRTAKLVRYRRYRGGRRRSKQYITFEHLRQLVLEEKIPSRRAYFLWWGRLTPLNAPLRPDLVYSNEWKGWNHFLGNENTPKDRRKYRSFEQARQYAQSRQFKTSKQYLQCKDHPKDIPARPDLVYKGSFLGWPHFLRNSKSKAALHSVIDAQRAENNPQQFETVSNDPQHILLFASLPHYPDNTYDITPHKDISKAKQYLTDTGLKFERAYYMPIGYDFKTVLKQFGKGYNSEYVLSNPYELFFELSLSLKIV